MLILHIVMPLFTKWKHIPKVSSKNVTALSHMMLEKHEGIGFKSCNLISLKNILNILNLLEMYSTSLLKGSILFLMVRSIIK